MAPLAARRLAEMVGLGERVVAIELVVAAQATELRGVTLGAGTAAARDALRATVPFADAGDLVHQDLGALVEAVGAGAFGVPEAAVEAPVTET